jgi:polynucleotide 5'-hydroxyl-kinase GRC3/NOL9
MEIVPEREWEILFDEIVKNKRTVVIIGANDSGKSTLVRFFINKFVSEKITVCLIDSDVGQSSLGLPGTISMKIFCDARDSEDFTFDKMSFIGAINPAKRIPFMIDCIKRMDDICRKSSDMTIIDTTGLVAGATGMSLKIAKINAVKPGHVIAVQRYDELEHILEHLKDFRIHRIRTSGKAKIRGLSARTCYRKKKFDDYFNTSEVSDFLLHTNEVRFFYNNRPFFPEEKRFKNGTLIGLNHGEDTLALGILDEITDAYITFRSPIKSMKKINKVVLGDITL